jgi:DNA-binding MarR family transcriptional regulator
LICFDVKILDMKEYSAMRSRDVVDQLIADWRRERPDLDASGMMVVGRIVRLAEHFRRDVETELARSGLSWEAFDVLATLRRAGPPFRLSPTALYRALLLSSGAMTNRIDRLESAGLVRRLSDPTDRRALFVALTPEGRSVIDAAVMVHARTIRRLVGGLAVRERQMLTRLLRKLLLSTGTDSARPIGNSRGRQSNRPRSGVHASTA